MFRSFADAMGFAWPRDVAYMVDGRQITWDDVKARRRERQTRELEWARRDDTPRIVPAYAWTFYVPGWLYSGWWCYMVTLHERYAVDCRIFDATLAASLMAAIPMGLLPLLENWEKWKELLAKTYPRRHIRRDPRKAGSVVGWWDQRGHRFALTRDELRDPIEKNTETDRGQGQ